jgi:hypothetical protein
MGYQEEIFEFLQKPENLLVALEVAKHVEALRPHFHQAFWKDMEQALRVRLEISASADRWTISTSGNFDEAWRNLAIRVQYLPPTFKGSSLQILYMQEAPPNYKLRYGLAWSKNRPLPNSEAFQKLLELSRSTGVPTPTRDVWWPAFCSLNISLRSDEFIQQYGVQSEKFVGELVERIWSYFTALEPTLYQVNQELIQDA